MWQQLTPIETLPCTLRVNSEDSTGAWKCKADTSGVVKVYPSLLVIIELDADGRKTALLFHLQNHNPSLQIVCDERKSRFSCEIQGTKKNKNVSLRFSTKQQLMRSVDLFNACRSRAILSEFTPLMTVGRGRFGKVVCAMRKRSTIDSKMYAVKEIHCHGKTAMYIWRERVILELLSFYPSPFVAHLCFATMNGAHAYLVMDFMGGGDLYNLLSSNVLSFQAVCFYAVEVLLALEHLHSLAIIYRDLKPENILVDKTGHIKLGDFGLSKLLQETLATTICGTAPYTPPEMFDMNGYSFSADYWQYGCLIFELFAGRSPFYYPNISHKELKGLITQASFEFPKNSSRRWQSLISKLIKPKVSDRLGHRLQDEGWDSVKSEPFFSAIDWETAKMKRVTPPFLPGMNIEENFEEEFTSLDPRFASNENENTACDVAWQGFEFQPHEEIKCEQI